MVRQLVALGHVATEGEYNTLALADSARSVLKGEASIVLRVPREPLPRSRLRGPIRAVRAAGVAARRTLSVTGPPNAVAEPVIASTPLVVLYWANSVGTAEAAEAR